MTTLSEYGRSMMPFREADAERRYRAIMEGIVYCSAFNVQNPAWRERIDEDARDWRLWLSANPVRQPKWRR